MEFKAALRVALVLALASALTSVGFAGTRVEGNYTIEITMDPDPVNDGGNATFTLKVTLDDGSDASGDFSNLALMIGPNTPDPPLVYDPATGEWTGTYAVNKPPGMQPGDTMPVTVYFYHPPSEDGGTVGPPGEWGVTDSEANPNQKKWKLTYSNPFYFDAIPPGQTSPFLLFGIFAFAAIVLLFFLIRRRSP